MKVFHDAEDRLPVYARSALHAIPAQPRALASEIDRLETQIVG